MESTEGISETPAVQAPVKNTRRLDERTTKIREVIYELARGGTRFSIDDVFDKIGGREEHGTIHANLLSAVKVGLTERAGKVKSRSQVKGEDWVTGNEGKSRVVQAYRGVAKLQRKVREDEKVNG